MASARERQPAEGPDKEAAMKILLAELRHIGLDSEGRVVCTSLKQRLERVWLQGYVLCRDGDDVVDLDDGSAVMSLDVGDLVASSPDIAGSALQAGRYISCVCALEVHPEGILDLRAESAFALDAPGDAMVEPFWWLEVAESHRLRRLKLGN
ncbi:unnamed protein product [Polarella glacialis]|uniref:Uncharacterized protein n=1 Tax=Polarella glacialis TaxID=89957 RepID=A0A813I0T4_POLGL|nr:unnamed protein product [Polarella glacialis]